VKRSRTIRLLLLGGLSASVLGGCTSGASAKAPVSAEAVYTNNYYVPGVGYYHAPFRGWYPLPYNHFDAQRQQYFYGGLWGPAPCANFTNLSSPTLQAAQVAEAQRTDISRGGFGSTSGSHWVHS
jgi:hypothetical protein